MTSLSHATNKCYWSWFDGCRIGYRGSAEIREVLMVVVFLIFYDGRFVWITFVYISQVSYVIFVCLASNKTRLTMSFWL
jgi:hypothetical protein